MKLYLLPIISLTFAPSLSFAHSGGTDSNGCHAGSQPYHCHNGGSDSSNDSESSIELGAWDINAGYQFQLPNYNFAPFAGFSFGKSEEDKDSELGFNLGLKHNNGWYGSFVSTSKSIQLGYDFWHVSVNSDYIGFGFRYPFGNSQSENQSSVYYSGSALFSSE